MRLNLIFGNVTNDKLRYKVAVNQYGWGRISRYRQTSSTWNICWRNGPWRGLVYPFIKMTKYTVVLLFRLASSFLPSSRAKLGPQSLVIFVEYKVTFFVSVTYYAWFSVISKEHNITISKVSEKIWFRSGIYSRLKTRCMAHLTYLSSSSGSVNSSWPSPAV